MDPKFLPGKFPGSTWGELPPFMILEREGSSLLSNSQKPPETEDNPPKTNMTMEIPPFEDVFPIAHGDVPKSC